jgi:hypothetical protein
MANQPTPATAQPPPELPNMPEVGTTLSDYLRRFSLWCRNGFADKLSSTSALPGVMLQAYDAAAGTTPKVFIIRVNTAGAISATPVALGGGKP